MKKLIDNLMIGYDTQDLEQMTGIEGARFAFLRIDKVDGRCQWLNLDREPYSFALDVYDDSVAAEAALIDYIKTVADEPMEGLDFTGATEGDR